MKQAQFLSKEDKLLITDAIKAAELNTSGEIRVHVESVIKGDVLDRAAYIFKSLKMHKTKERNGILFYLAQKSRKFAIIGDAGINAKVPANFWDSIKEKMAADFTSGIFAQGLSNGIRMAGEQLKIHFPYQKDDINELSDEISFGK
jgi:uncharacterized membrane protein